MPLACVTLRIQAMIRRARDFLKGILAAHAEPEEAHAVEHLESLH